MAIFSNIRFYNFNPVGNFSTTVGGTTAYSGPATAVGKANITDNEFGVQGYTLDDDNNGGETATATVTRGALTSTNTTVDAENAWLLRDTVTGETFNIISFDVENGAASGMYLISEVPLVVGRSYETLAYDSNPDATNSWDPVLNYNDYYANWSEVDGTAGDDLINGSYVDSHLRVIDGGDGTGPARNEDVVFAGDGNDTVLAGAGNDTVYGGNGNDSLSGGAGNDVLYGDSTDAAGGSGTAQSEFLDWSAVGADETNIEGGFTQNTGSMDVTMSWVDNGGSSTIGASVESSETTYVGGGEPFDPTSSMVLDGAGGANTSTTTISFAGASGSGMTDEVENVAFRLNDIDTGSFTDRLTIRAYDADGNQVPVNITPSGADTVSPDGHTITAATGSNSPDQAQGSALVEIGGPVSYFTIVYQNVGSGRQIVHVSDVHFDTIPAVSEVDGGDDTLDGGIGADTMYGEGGNDTFTVAQGDVAQGGDGDDTFNLVDLAEAGSSTITIVGGEGGETLGDTLNFGGLINNIGDVTITNANDAAGGLSGHATLSDGTVVNFSEIETLVICYAPGTMIATPKGPCPVESLNPGDLVMTQDRGPQPIRWVSSRDVPLEEAEPEAKPVLIKAGALGDNLPADDLIVSPQHRVLVGENGQLSEYFAEPALVPAKSLTSLPGIRHMNGKQKITWHHFACDQHEVVMANGCQLESLLLGPMVLNGLTAPEVDDLATIFHSAPAHGPLNGPAVRPCLNVGEVRRLLEMCYDENRRAVA